MKSIVFVTTNKGKAREVKKIIEKIEVKIVGLELREKKHLSHEKLVQAKAKHAFELVGKPVVVEDTGIFVEGFKDYPGLRSREVFEKIGFRGFLEKCGGRKAFFRTIAGFYDGKRMVLFKGICKGRIGRKVEGRKIEGLPFLNVFIPNGFSKPVAAFSKKDLEKFLFKTNHRAKAFKKFEKWFLLQ